MTLKSLLICLALCALPVSAWAQLSHNLSIGNPEAMAMGNAGVASTLGTDSIHFNPAALAVIETEYTQYKVQAAFFSHSGEVSGTGNGQSYDPFDNPDFQTDPLLQGQRSQSIEVDSPSAYLPFIGHLDVPFYIAPGYGRAFRSDDGEFVFANSMFALQVFGYQREYDNAGAFNGETFGITRISYFNPTLSFQLDESLYFGASIGFSWQGLGVETRTRSALNAIAELETVVDDYPELGLALNPYNDVGKLSMEMSDPLSVAWTVGLLWQPVNWLSVGMTYQSQGKSRLEGDFSIDYTDSFNALMNTLQPLEGLLRTSDGGNISGLSRQTGEVSMDFVHPAWAGLGVSVLVTPRWRVNADVKYVGYSSLREMRFEFDQDLDYLTLASVVNYLNQFRVGGDYADPNVLALQRRYESVIDWSFGVEYKWDDRWKLRAGFEKRSASIPEDRRDVMIPIGDALLFTTGFGYQLANDTRVDAAVGYLYSDFTIEPGGSRNVNSNIEGDVIYNPYRALKVDYTLQSLVFALTYAKYF